MKLEYTLTPLQEKAINFMTVDPQGWFSNFVEHRIRIAMQDIYDLEVAKMKADPNVTSIPLNVEEVVAMSTEKSAAERLETPPPMQGVLI